MMLPFRFGHRTVKISFFSEAKLKRIPVTGGVAVVLCDAPDTRGGSWGSRGQILFSVNLFGLYQVSEDGGTRVQVTRPDHDKYENSHRFPVFLPDGNRFLFFNRTDSDDTRSIQIDSLDHRTPRKRIIVADGQFALPRNPLTGDRYLLTSQVGGIIAQPFHDTSGEAAGTVTVLLQGTGQLTASDTGIVILRRVPPVVARLVWRDRLGKETGTVGLPTDYTQVTISTDDKFRAVVKHDRLSGHFTLWLATQPEGLLEPTSTSNSANQAVWAHDSNALYFCDSRMHQLLKRSLRPSAPEETIRTVPGGYYVHDVSPNGHYLVGEFSADSRHSELIWSTMKEGPWHRMGITGEKTMLPSFSPDGRWVAYSSDQAGSTEVYITDFPGGTVRERVSTAGGAQPRWLNNGKELVYFAPDDVLTSVDVTNHPTFKMFTPRSLFHATVSRDPFASNYSLSKDGQRFLITERENQVFSGDLEMLLNWPRLLGSPGLTA